LPGPEASASAEPVIPEKMIELIMLTCARAPFRLPTSALENEKIISVTLPEFIISAMKDKKWYRNQDKARIQVGKKLHSDHI